MKVILNEPIAGKNYEPFIKAAQIMNEVLGIEPKELILDETSLSSTAKIRIGKNDLKSLRVFIPTYAHELGHNVKFQEKDGKKNLLKDVIPRIAFSYLNKGLFLAYTGDAFANLNRFNNIIDNQYVSKICENIREIPHLPEICVGLYAANLAITSIPTKKSEHDADLIAYNLTALPPKEWIPDQSFLSLMGGYPTLKSRDAYCLKHGNPNPDPRLLEMLAQEAATIKNKAI